MEPIELVTLVWIVAIAGIFAMKKIEPDNKIYPVWAILVCIILSLFVAWYESLGSVVLITL